LQLLVCDSDWSVLLEVFVSEMNRHLFIGPGDEYCSWFVRERQSKKSTRNPKRELAEINRAIAESKNRVNAIAMFLIKKSFRFIRSELCETVCMKVGRC
jgi:hypothetical protein